MLARSVFLLSLISHPSFNIENKNDADYLWEVMYNQIWSSKTERRFVKGVKELMLSSRFNGNITFPKSRDSVAVKSVAKFWLNILTEKSFSSFVEERLQFVNVQLMRKGYNPTGGFLDFLGNPMIKHAILVFEKVLSSNVPQSLEENLMAEVTRYFHQGSSSHSERSDSFNPMFLHETDEKWRLNHDDTPYDGFLPFEEGELDFSNKENILKQSCLKILKKIILQYRKRMSKIEFIFHRCDPLELCYDSSLGRFDAIDSSDLADHMGLANILNAGGLRLSDEPGARLYTETERWQKASANILHFIEEVLCCPLNMTPTCYGLHLADHVELGAAKLPHVNSHTRLAWDRTPQLMNVQLALSRPLQKFSDSLAKKCFVSTTNDKDPSITQYYSPLTYLYTLNSLKNFLQTGGHCVKFVKLETLRVFKLQNSALEDWSSGKAVKLVTVSAHLRSLFKFALCGNESSSFSETYPLVLRAVLIPFNSPASILEELDPPGVHFIDNVRVDLTRSVQEILELKFSFLVPLKEKVIGKGYDILLVDVTTKEIVTYPSLSSFKAETFQMDFPFRSVITVIPPVEKVKNLSVATGIELEDHFMLNIPCPSNISEEDLAMYCKQQWPCRSTHVVSLAFEKSAKFLEMMFPHAVLVNEAKLSLNSESVCLFLPKAIFEPWPSDSNIRKPLEIEKLHPWTETKGGVSKLKLHLDDQFCGESPRSLKLSLLIAGPLVMTRSSIAQLFEVVSSQGLEQFAVVFCNVGGDNDELQMRAHLPFRTSPTGAPLLLLSVLDKKQEKILEQEKKIRKGEWRKMHTELFGRAKSFLLPVLTEEEMKLWRYILKLNSLKISQKKWPVRNLPTGEKSPWMTTYTSPRSIANQTV